MTKTRYIVFSKINIIVKGTQSAGAHAHFIANLHITEIQSILFLTKFDEILS